MMYYIPPWPQGEVVPYVTQEWCFYTTTTPCKRDRDAATDQYEVISGALLAIQAMPETDALQDVLQRILHILDAGDIYNQSTNSLTFCEGLGFLQIWDYTRPKANRPSGELKGIIHDVQICLLDRFCLRVQLLMQTLLANQVAYVDARQMYIDICYAQLLG